MPITQFTNLPGRGQDQSTFSARADHLLGVQLPRFVNEANDLAAEIDADVQTVIQVANIAQAAADSAQGVVSFKGDWSTLTGAMAPPASVRHRGRIWVLLASLPNVALAEPGVDLTRWQSVNRGMVAANSNFSAFSGDDVLCPASTAVTITLPQGPSAGDFVKVARAGTGGVTVVRNGATILNVADDFVIDRPDVRLAFMFTGTTWRISMEGILA